MREETFFAVDPLHLEVCEVVVLNKNTSLVRDVDTGEQFKAREIFEHYEPALDYLEDMMTSDYLPGRQEKAEGVGSLVLMVLVVALLIYTLF